MIDIILFNLSFLEKTMQNICPEFIFSYFIEKLIYIYNNLNHNKFNSYKISILIILNEITKL